MEAITGDKDVPMQSENQLFDVEALIKAVQNRPAIWNMTAVDYNNRMIRPKLWKDITKELNIESNSININKLKRRWDQIRTSYLKNKKSTVMLNPYRYTKLLSFLDGTIIPRQYNIYKMSLEEKELEKLASPNPSNQHEPFEYVAVKQEPGSFITNDQQPSTAESSTSITTIEYKGHFNEIKTESEDYSAPQPQSSGISIKSHMQQNKPTIVDQACQTEELFVKNATREPIAILKRQNEQLMKCLAIKQMNYPFGKISIESLKGQNRKVRYLTGFPSFETMEIIYNDVEKKLPPDCRISKFDIFFMTWVKLKLDLSLDYLSILMNVSLLTTTRLFHKTFVILYDRLREYIVWPDGTNHRETTPISYNQIFGDRRFIIIDCFEFFSDRIGNINNLASSSINDNDTVQERSIEINKLKSHSRPVKYFLCFSTGGTIIYLSKPFDTGLTKNCIAQQSGFLDVIETGDIILGNREFDTKFVDKQKRKYNEIVPMVKNAEGELVEMLCEITDEFCKIQEDIVKRIIFAKQRVMMLTNRLTVLAVTNKFGEEMYSDFVITMACAIVNLTPPQSEVVKVEEATESSGDEL